MKINYFTTSHSDSCNKYYIYIYIYIYVSWSRKRDPMEQTKNIYLNLVLKYWRVFSKAIELEIEKT